VTLFDLEAPEPAPLAEVAVLSTEALREMLRCRYAQVSPGNGPRYVLANEVRNVAGFGLRHAGRVRSCDLIAVDTWDSGPVRLIGHEIKASRSDWLRELVDPSKAHAFDHLVAEWWLVADRTVAHPSEIPPGWGWMAPAGGRLRQMIAARRKPQPELPIGFVAALARAIANRSVQP